MTKFIDKGKVIPPKKFLLNSIKRSKKPILEALGDEIRGQLALFDKIKIKQNRYPSEVAEDLYAATLRIISQVRQCENKQLPATPQWVDHKNYIVILAELMEWCYAHTTVKPAIQVNRVSKQSEPAPANKDNDVKTTPQDNMKDSWANDAPNKGRDYATAKALSEETNLPPAYTRTVLNRALAAEPFLRTKLDDGGGSNAQYAYDKKRALEILSDKIKRRNETQMKHNKKS